jgi:hypothetical protein
MALPPRYKIHPAIGVARLGDATSGFFIGPEVPGRPAEGDAAMGGVVPPFKDSSAIKRQAARFRIWQYADDGKGKYKPVEEKSLASKDVEWIVWTVHLANKKAAFFQFKGLVGDPVFGPAGATHPRRNAAVTNPKALWLDPGLRKISGKNKKQPISKGTAPSGSSEFWPITPPSPAINELGELRTDDAGRLVVLGGRGHMSAVGSAAITNYANNDGWFDDVSDGPVNAQIKIKGVSKPFAAVGSWCLCAPPSFGLYARNTVSLWDTLLDVAARELVLPTNEAVYDGAWAFLRDLNAELKTKPWGYVALSTFVPVFERDIWPTLQAALDAVSLFGPAQHVHSTLGSGGVAAMYAQLASPLPASSSLRQTIFRFLHRPGVPGNGVSTGSAMPKLLGDDPYSTASTATRLRLTVTPTQYAMLERWANGKFVALSTAPPALPPATITPEGLDRAQLEACVGGAFFPGIECGWQIRHPKLYAEPFRINQSATTQYTGDTGSVSAGHFSRQMALPWAADFLQCRREDHDGTAWGWWPVPRPNDVYATQALALAASSGAAMVPWARSTASGVPQNWPSGQPEPNYSEMFANWTKFGFVVRTAGVLFETERAASIP